MPNKLLMTVVDLYNQINDLKGKYPTILEALIDNPEIGKTKVEGLESLIVEAKGGFDSIDERISYIDGRLGDAISKIGTITEAELKPLIKAVTDAKGDFESLKAAIDNAGVSINVNYNDKETILTLDNDTAVKSDIVTVPAGQKKIINLRKDIDNSLYSMLIQDSYSNYAAAFNLKDSLSKNNITLFKNTSGDYIELNTQAEDMLFPMDPGNYYKESSYEEYYVKDSFIAGAQNISVTPLSGLFKPYSKKIEGEYYKTVKNLAYNTNAVSVYFDFPILVTKIRVYPYTRENTTNRYSIGAFYKTDEVYEDYQVNPKPQGHSRPDAYVDHPINSLIDYMAISFSCDEASYNYLGAIEIYVKPLNVNKAVYSTEKVPMTVRDITELNSITTDGTVTKALNQIFYALCVDDETYAYKPEKYKVGYDKFLDAIGRPVNTDALCIHETGLKNNLGSIYVLGNSSKDTLYYPNESFTASRDFVWNGNYQYWSDGGSDAFDGFGYTNITINGVTRELPLGSGTYNYNIGGAGVIVRNTFPAKNLLRMEVYPTNALAVQFSAFNSWGNMGSDSGSNYATYSFTYNGRTVYYHKNWDNGGDPDILFCVVPGDIENAGISYSRSSDNLTISLSNQRLPLIYYIYVGYQGTDPFVNAIKEDLTGRNLLGLNFINPDSRNLSFFKKDQTYFLKQCTKEWEQLSIDDIEQENNGAKYLISFDEGTTWLTVQSESWRISQLNDILLNGMTKLEMLAISKELFDLRLSDYIMIAVRFDDEITKFKSITFNTGSNALMKVSDSDIFYYKANSIDNINNLPDVTSWLNKLDIESGGNIGLKFLFHAIDRSFKGPRLKNAIFNIGAKNYWRNLSDNDLDRIAIRYFEKYTEIVNSSTKDVTLRLNSIMPSQATLLDKETGVNLEHISDFINQYKSEKTFLESIKNSVISSIRADNFVVHESSQLLNYMLGQFYAKAGEEYYTEYYHVNGLKFNNMTISGGSGYNYSTNKYVVSPTVAKTYFTTPKIAAPLSDYSAISIHDYCNKKPAKIEIIINEGAVTLEVRNNKIALEEILSVYQHPILNLYVKFTYDSSDTGFEFTGYSVRFENRQYLADNSKIKIPVNYDNQTRFVLPFSVEQEAYIKVSIQGITQERDVDYRIVTEDQLYLEWISTDFNLEAGDELTAELIL